MSQSSNRRRISTCSPDYVYYGKGTEKDVKKKNKLRRRKHSRDLIDELLDDIQISAPEKSPIDKNVTNCRNVRKRKINTACEDLTNNDDVHSETLRETMEAPLPNIKKSQKVMRSSSSRNSSYLENVSSPSLYHNESETVSSASSLSNEIDSVSSNQHHIEKEMIPCPGLKSPKQQCSVSSTNPEHTSPSPQDTSSCNSQDTESFSYSQFTVSSSSPQCSSPHYHCTVSSSIPQCTTPNSNHQESSLSSQCATSPCNSQCTAILQSEAGSAQLELDDRGVDKKSPDSKTVRLVFGKFRSRVLTPVQRKLPEVIAVTKCEPEVIDLTNESPPDCNISDDVQMVPPDFFSQTPECVKAVVPPGISINPTSSTTKTVSLPANVAGALACVANSQHVTTKTKVTLELSNVEIAALKTLGII